MILLRMPRSAADQAGRVVLAGVVPWVGVARAAVPRRDRCVIQKWVVVPAAVVPVPVRELDGQLSVMAPVPRISWTCSRRWPIPIWSMLP